MSDTRRWPELYVHRFVDKPDVAFYRVALAERVDGAWRYHAMLFFTSFAAAQAQCAAWNLRGEVIAGG